MATRLGRNTIDLNYGNNSVGGDTNAPLYRLSGNAFFPFTNRIINGDFTVNQRNPGVPQTYNINNTTVGHFPHDRWYAYGTQATKFSASIIADGPVINTTYSNSWGNAPISSYPPRTFKNCVELKSLASTTLGVSDYFTYSQAIEGRHIMDMDFGSVGTGNGSGSTRKFVLSFYAKASAAGNYHIFFRNSANNRIYKTYYQIVSANTWERKAIFVPVDQTGTWLNSTGVGLRVIFSLGLGSNYLGGTGETWTAETTLGTTNPPSPASTVHLVNTLNATLRLTGIQLEYLGIPPSVDGDTQHPSDFQSRLWQDEYKLCQRYYQKSWQYAVQTNSQTVDGMFINSNDLSTNVVQQYNHIRWPGGPLRGSPTVQPYSYGNPSAAGQGSYWNSAGTYIGDAVAYTTAASSCSAMFYFASTFSKFLEGYHWVADADIA